MCRAYDGLFTNGVTWAVNEMFIDPLPQHDPYTCSTAYVNSDGSDGPVLRPDGTPIPDQDRQRVRTPGHALNTSCTNMFRAGGDPSSSLRSNS